MGKSLYFECASGISGDMTAAALIDLGADRELLKKALDSVPAGGFRTEITRVKKSGIDCCDFNVILDTEHENHDHDMTYLYGHENGAAELHGEEHDHSHDDHEPGGHHHDDDNHEPGGHHHDDHDHGGHHHDDHDHGGHHHDDDDHDHGGHHHHDHDDHDHGHHHHDHDDHDHTGHHHGHSHRHLSEINDILDRTEMTDGARALAKRMFGILAEAEAQAHGIPAGEVHFHEVGAIDSIVDIITIAVCFDDLRQRNEITDVILKSVSEGTGTVRCQHGILPVPVPAVLNIIRSHDLPLRIMDVRGEFVTPTGAAFLAAVRTKDQLPDSFRVTDIGLGAGKRKHELPGILRVMMIKEA